MSPQTPAAVLTAALASSTIEPTPLHRRQSAPLRVMLERRREPLDLEASVFRYRVDSDGAIHPCREHERGIWECARHRRRKCALQSALR